MDPSDLLGLTVRQLVIALDLSSEDERSVRAELKSHLDGLTDSQVEGLDKFLQALVDGYMRRPDAGL